MNLMQLNQYIDHTLLKPTTLIEDIKRICDEAIAIQFCGSLRAAAND